MSDTELAWFKSSYSGTSGDNCIEVAVTDQGVYVRDSKDVTGPHLAIDHDEWAQFVKYAAHG
jgi:hypothetical protein